jgi:hypothetical protein
MKGHRVPLAVRGLPALFALLALGCAAPSLAAGKTSRPDPDMMLIEVYKDLGARHLRDALAKADMLVAAYPNFQLGHLVRGDLLLMQTHEVDRFGAVNGAAPEALASLRQEASARLKALYERPGPGLVPRAVLQLRRDQKKVLLVDASRSRLYVYENRQGQLRFERDFYISQGKLGVDKAREGDQKTPLGVYYVTGRLAGRRLPDLYGVGALPISYPKEWDRLHGRDGSGIWLHGTPARNYSRPPLSSDGCVVLTNPDLRLIYATIQIAIRPQWSSPAKLPSSRPGRQIRTAGRRRTWWKAGVPRSKTRSMNRNGCGRSIRAASVASGAMCWTTGWRGSARTWSGCAIRRLR